LDDGRRRDGRGGAARSGSSPHFAPRRHPGPGASRPAHVGGGRRMGLRRAARSGGPASRPMTGSAPGVETPSGAESTRTVVVALLATFGVAFAKLAAAVVSASAAVLAEALHAFADAGNELLLLVAQRRSRHPADRHHPIGYGREAYFWALIASIGVFVTGAVL